MKVWPGQPYPLGAVYDGSGTNFSLFSGIASRVELCLFDDEDKETCVDLPEATGFCWHGYLPSVKPGQRYGYRVHGPWDPANGHRCNPAKLLLDPYAKAIEGEVRWDEAVFPYRFQDGPEVCSDSNSAAGMPRCVVHQPQFDWSGDRRLQLPWHETVIYEAHVKGLTATHPDIAPELRGTYAGLMVTTIIAHGTAVSKVQRTTPTCCTCEPVNSATFWQLFFSHKACPCCWEETRSAARRVATTMRTAKTMQFPGLTGKTSIKTFFLFVRGLFAIAKRIRCFTAVAGFKAGPFTVVR